MRREESVSAAEGRVHLTLCCAELGWQGPKSGISGLSFCMVTFQAKVHDNQGLIAIASFVYLASFIPSLDTSPSVRRCGA